MTTTNRRTMLRNLGAVALLVVLFPSHAAKRPLTAHAKPRTATASTRQMVVVDASASDPTSATVTGYTGTGATWKVATPSFPARLGSNGVTMLPTEADGATPAGTYNIKYAFGTDALVRTRLPYTQVTNDDHWVDDVSSAFYNTWQVGDPVGRWGSAEDLDDYSLAVVFDFNQDPVVSDGNSAIFLHAGSPSSPSAGCVTVSDDDLRVLVRWLNPAARPQITIGVGAGTPGSSAASV